LRRGAHGVPSSSEGFCSLERVWHHHADDANRPSCFSRPYIMWAHPSTRRHTGTPTRHLEQLQRAVPGAPLAHPCHVWQTEHSHNANPTKTGQDVAFTVGAGCSRQHPKTNERIRGWILTYSMALCLCSEPALTGGLLRTVDAEHPDLIRIQTYLRDNCIKIVIATNKSGDEEERVPRNEWRGTLWAILLKHQPR
jgi:hypothetical protein